MAARAILCAQIVAVLRLGRAIGLVVSVGARSVGVSAMAAPVHSAAQSAERPLIRPGGLKLVL